MGGMSRRVAAEMTAYFSATVSAYAGAVPAKSCDDAADTTAGLGRGLLHRVFRQQDGAELLPEPLGALAVDPAVDDALALDRTALQKMLTTNPVLMVVAQSTPAVAAGLAQQVVARRDPYSAAKDQAVIDYRPTG